MAKWNYIKFDPRALKFGQDVWDPTFRFETSWLFVPWVLFGLRALISLYAFTVLFFIIGWEASGVHPGYSIHDVHKSFSFFTVLTYWGIACYFAVAAIHTFSYALHGNKPLLNRFPRPLQALHSFFFTTVTTLPFLVTVVYWGILYDSSFDTKYEWWSNISQHAFNSAFALFEIVFTRVGPAPWIHTLWLVILMGLYCALAYVTYATKHYFVYSFLNFTPKVITTDAEGHKHTEGGQGTGGVIGYIVGIGIGIVFVFCLSKGACALRKWLTETKGNKTGKFYGGREIGHAELEMQTMEHEAKGSHDLA